MWKGIKTFPNIFAPMRSFHVRECTNVDLHERERGEKREREPWLGQRFFEILVKEQAM